MTSTVAGRLDQAISSRLATAAYTAPANADVAAIKAQTDKLAFAGAGPYDIKATLDGETVTAATVSDKAGYSLSAAGVTAVQSGLSTLTAAQVNAEVDTALSDAGVSTTVMGRLDAAVSTRLATANYTAPANADVAAIKAQTDKLAFTGGGPYDVKATLDGETVTAATVSDKTGYALSAAGVSAVQSGLSTLTAAQVNAEVDQALADVGLTTAVTARIDQAISTRLAAAAYTAPANADIVAIKNRTDNLPDSPTAVGSEMALGEGATAAVAAAVWAATDRALSINPATATAAQIADAVWDENGSDHNSPDTTGNKLNSASAAGDPWTATLSGYGAGSAGKLVYDNLNAPVSSRSSHDAPAVATAVWSSATRTLANDPTLATIKTQTDKIVAGGATVAHLQPAAEAAILANLGNITADILNGNLASVAAPGNLAGTLLHAAADPWAQTGLSGYAAGSAGKLLADNLNAPVGSRASHTPAAAAAAVWSATGRTLAGDTTLAAIKAQTDKIVSGGAAVADLLPAATAAIQNARLHQLLAAPLATPAAGSLLVGLVETHASAWRFTAAALGATPVTTPVIDTAAIAGAVWSAAASGWAPETMGQRLTADMPDAALIAAAVWSASLAGYNAPNTAGALLKNTTSFPTPAQIAAHLWETSTTGYANLTGTMGHRLHAATPPGIAAAVWNTAKAAHTTAGMFGALLDAPVSGRLPHVAGSGPVAFTYSLTSQSDNSPIEGVEVVVTDDITGYHVVAEAVTAGTGGCVFNLSPGTYYFWRHKPGWSFVDPDTQTVNT